MTFKVNDSVIHTVTLIYPTGNDNRKTKAIDHRCVVISNPDNNKKNRKFIWVQFCNGVKKLVKPESLRHATD